MVLDDAADAGQVRQLRPGGRDCGVLITSRGRLGGLEGVHRIDLDVLPPADALVLLAATAGSNRVAAEPQAASRIVEVCGGLPLALRIAGGKLADRPHWSLGKLASRLVDQRRHLDELRLGDLEVRSSLRLSLRGLEPDVDVAGRRLALLDAPSFPAWAAVAALRVTLPVAEELIDMLVERQLIEFAGTDAFGQARYRFHDLVRLCLREHAAETDDAAARVATVSNGLGGWLTLGLRAVAGATLRAVPRTRAGSARRLAHRCGGDGEGERRSGGLVHRGERRVARGCMAGDEPGAARIVRGSEPDRRAVP